MKKLFSKAMFLAFAFFISGIFKAQTISTIAGTVGAGYSGDGGVATSAQLNNSAGVALDAFGNIYIADASNHRIRKVSPTGTITTFAGTGVGGFSGDGGQAVSAQLNNPFGIAVDAIGNVYIGDFSNHRVRKVNTLGVISTIAGTTTAGFSGDGAAANLAQLNLPFGVAVDGAGNIYIVDSGNNRVRKISNTGIISTIAGTTVAGFGGDGGIATLAQLNNPRGVSVDGAGNVYIADMANQKVRKINTSGIISTIAGTTTGGYSGDGGQATIAQLTSPHGVAIDKAGNVYIADAGNHRIRKVNTSGVISTYAGTGTSGYSGDGGAATSAQLNIPAGINIDAGGNIFIADASNNRIRKVTCIQPTVITSSSPTLICSGETATLTASGANSYSWNSGGTGTTFVVSPTVTTTYTVTGTDGNGCVNTSIITQSVSTCTGIEQLSILSNEMNIYPNPFNNKVTIVTSVTVDTRLQIYNVLGSLIYSAEINDKVEIDLSHQCAGIYFVRIGTLTKKIIKY